MPELPEVEVIARRLAYGSKTEAKIVGKVVTSARVSSTKTLKEPARQTFTKKIVGARFVDVKRRAKHLLLHTDRGVLMVHLRLTGDLHVVRGEEPKFTRVALDLDDGSTLAFSDGRHLGEMRLVDDVEPVIGELGPEPLDPSFTAGDLRDRLKGKRAIKATLLDQSVLAGVGNIYADESLWRAKLWPERLTSSLTPAEIKKLHASIVAALNDSIQALEKEDRDIRWRYADRDSESEFDVYDRGGEPCHRCKTKLVQLTVGGRTTVACRKCQR